jgi:uncharacterized protein YjiS (DUF1127 family)
MSSFALALKGSAPRLRAAGRFVASLFTGIADGHEIARRYEELSRLSDEALAARGITREELPQAIVTGRICR